MWGGVPVKLAVVSTASVLLLFASNTGIIGAYHVFLALANGGFLPQAVTWRNRQFGSPHLAICVATLVPIGVVIVTQAELGLLADMYVFGLLGAFVMSSAGLDLIRWRRRQHGIGFWVGILTTLMLAVAWGVNIFEKPHATLFGGALIATGMVISVSAQQGWFSDWWYQIPFIARAASQRISAAELETEEIPNLISLSEAHEIMTLYPSRTLVAMRGRNLRLIEEAITREKGLNGKPFTCCTSKSGQDYSLEVRHENPAVRVVRRSVLPPRLPRSEGLNSSRSGRFLIMRLRQLPALPGC